MSTETGGPAFPIPGAVSHYDSGTVSDPHHAGMTLRDYFAAMAMHALINPKGENFDRLTEVPEYAYQIADAMLAERSRA